MLNQSIFIIHHWFAQQFCPKSQSHQLPVLNCVSLDLIPTYSYCHEGNYACLLEKGAAVHSEFKSPGKI